MIDRQDFTGLGPYFQDTWDNEIDYHSLLNRYAAFFDAVGETTTSHTLTDQAIPAQRDPRYRYFVLWTFFKFSLVREELVPIGGNYDYLLDLILIIIGEEDTKTKISKVMRYYIDNNLTPYIQLTLDAFNRVSEIYRQIATAIEDITQTQSDLVKNIISQFLIFMLALDDSKETWYEIYATEA